MWTKFLLKIISRNFLRFFSHPLSMPQRSFDNIPSQRFNFSKLSHHSLFSSPILSRFETIFFLIFRFNEESSPHESYLEGKKFYHPLSDTLLLRFPFADEGNVYALVQHLLPNLRTFFSPRWWPTKTIHVRHAFFHQRCFTLSICIYIYFLWSNENYRIFIYKSPSFLHFITFLLSHLHFFPFFV